MDQTSEATLAEATTRIIKTTYYWQRVHAEEPTAIGDLYEPAALAAIAERCRELGITDVDLKDAIGADVEKRLLKHSLYVNLEADAERKAAVEQRIYQEARVAYSIADLLLAAPVETAEN